MHNKNMDKVSHFEILVENAERAQRIYKSAFDWNIISMPNMGYTMLHTGPTSNDGMVQDKGFINGGMFKRTDQLKNPVITVVVADIKKSVEKIKKLGGAVVKEPFKVGDVGLSAYVKDTEGNIIGVFQSLR